MNQRTLVFTTSDGWFKKEFADIRRIQEQSKGLVAEHYHIKKITLDTLPTEKRNDGKIVPSWAWFKNTLTAQAKGYTQIVLHISKKDRKRFGISETLGGSYNRDKDEFIEFWMCCDEGQKSKHYKGKSEFWRLFLHESSHGYERFLMGYESELTHHWDYTLHAIDKLYSLYNWTAWGKLYDTFIGVKALLGAQAQGKLLPAVSRTLGFLKNDCEEAGVPIRLTSSVRSCEAQDALFAQGRTIPGSIVTNAKCGESLHNFGVAFDVCFDSQTPYQGDWEKVGKIGEKLGLEWGGRWKSFPDKPHFQLVQGYTLQDFQTGKVDYKKFI